MRLELIDKIRHYIRAAIGFVVFGNLFILILSTQAPKATNGIIWKISSIAFVLVLVPFVILRMYDIVNSRYGLLSKNIPTILKCFLLVLFPILVILTIGFAGTLIFFIISRRF